MARSYAIETLITDIRRRWRRRALVQGAALSVMAFVFLASLLLALRLALEATPRALTVGVLAAGVALLGLIVWFVVRPGLRRLTDQQIALYVEEQIPDLEDRLNSAVEIDGSAAAPSDALLDRLIDDAARRARTIPLSTIVDRRRERILSYAGVAFGVLFLVFAYGARDALRTGLAGVGLDALIAPDAPLMTVAPGNVEVERGASQEIVADLREEARGEVVLHFREGDAPWQKVEMQAGVDRLAFLYELHDLQAPVQYFVAYGEHRSEPFTVSLYTFPQVQQVDLTYRYPAYTGLPDYTEENTGDIRGLRGSRVTVSVHATGTVEDAALVLDEGIAVPLAPAGDGRFQGTLTLDAPGFYEVRLTDARQKTNKFPEAYQITPLDDEPPFVTVTDPQRDVRVNAIEEVLVAARVDDDYGVKGARLRYAVNGGEEQALDFDAGAETRPRTVEGEHLFYLEDFGLAPGDVISYYVEADDHFHETPALTDMYFIEVIPFDQQYRQASAAGNMQGGGQPSGIVLSQQQIIAATWNLLRRRADLSADDFGKTLDGLVQAQSNLKANIEERINNTAFSLELRLDERNRQIVDHLRDAAGEMEKAALELRKGALRDALTPERRALNHLLKADALNQERQVALNRNSGGQGGGSTEERMTELMDLELDISKDKYEVQQQGSQRQGQQEVEETLRRLQELARRQQSLANQMQRDELRGEDRRRHVERLKRDQDELRRQTESLAQQLRQDARGNEQMSQDMEGRLERVARNMQEAEDALRRDDVPEAMRSQQQALDELNRLRQGLQVASTDNTRELLDDLTEQFETLREQEEALARDLSEARKETQRQGGRPNAEALEDLARKRQRLQENLDGLDARAAAVEEHARPNDPELATDARNLRQRLRREELERMMDDSEQALRGGWLDHAQRLEEEIATSMERVATQMRAFEGRRPVTGDEQIARALEDLRDLQEQLRDLQARTRAQNQAGRQNQQGSPEAQNGQPGQSGQPGQQPGQAGPDTGREARAENARNQRQLERARETLERLQRDLQGDAQAQNALRGLRSALNDASFTGTLLEGEAADAYFKNRVYDPLSQLELELARRLDLLTMERKLHGARSGDVPAAYRALVEKYYEALAKERN